MRKNIILLLVAGISFSMGAEKVKKINVEYNDGTTISIDRSKVQKITFTEYTPAEQIFKVGEVEFKMLKVEKGTFTMGATSEQVDPEDDEKPTHQVTLTKDYYMGMTEVTQALWKAVMGSENNPSNFKGDELPVENVSYNDITGTDGFIAKLNAATRETFRLPTEAEWEFAARGGNKSQGYQYSGSNTATDVAWNSSNSDKKTHAVATLTANELGLYDMSGNVNEWCSDWKSDYSSEAQTDPTGPATGVSRVYRGGSCASSAYRSRCSFRNYIKPTYSDNYIGLRLALSAE